MNTRYSRPLHGGEGPFAAAWMMLPATLLAAGLALLALLALLATPAAPPQRAETATELPSLPPAA